ncbi:MANF/CDNF-like protein [Thelohanellus kitauei]|uniref:Mesencephalic astrocyte-derived neurotrophic factor homolog n=1 Tax=Thelohanellus kitauei TaxID=669202 RepID=A0A0C2MNP5_THEKT|nr:MANF/CDNF-like protein [Thelohanellus kitauei]
MLCVPSVGFLFLVCLNFFQIRVEAINVEKCRSCIDILEELNKVAANDIKSKNLDGFMQHAKDLCKPFTHGSPKEKICYAIGARQDSSSSLLNDIFDSMYLPTEKHCMQLHEKYGSICNDKVKIPIDWTNLKKYSTKELKAFLNQENDQCKGCLEKSEYIQQLLTHKPKSEL